MNHLPGRFVLAFYWAELYLMLKFALIRPSLVRPECNKTMSLPTFGQLLSEYMLRSGISDSELARAIGVRRQTIFRWKEGLVERPRAREDVLQCAKKLRLSNEERDRLLLSAGFPPEQLTLAPLADPPPAPIVDRGIVDRGIPPNEPLAPIDFFAQTAADQEADSAIDPRNEEKAGEPTEALPAEIVPAFLTSDRVGGEGVTELPALKRLAPVVTPAEQAVGSFDTVAASPTYAPTPAHVATPTPQPSPMLRLLRDRRLRWWPVAAGLLVVLVLGRLWTNRTAFLALATPTPLAPATVVLYPPPQTTPTGAVDYPTAKEGETLLLIAQFKGYTRDQQYNVAGRIREELEQQIAAAGLISTTLVGWPDEITTVQKARELLTATNATLIIWGEYDSGRVHVQIEARNPTDSQSRDFTLGTADELVTTINSIVPKEIRDTALIALSGLVDQMAIGQRLSDLGSYQAAAVVFQRALDRKPEDQKTAAWLNFYLGYLTEKAQTLAAYTQAIAYYGRAFTLNDRLIDALYNRGTLQIKRAQILPANEPMILENLNGAIADFTEVIIRRPDYLNGYINRGVAYYERDAPDDMAAALQDLNHVIAQETDHLLAYYSRGLVYIRLGRGLEWVQDFQQILRLQPDHGSAISALCWGYALAQEPTKALPYCNQAVALDKSGASNDSRAIAYAQLGRHAEAVADLRIYLDSLQAQESVALYERSRGPMIEPWIAQLEAGKNPFDATLLEKLRHRDHY